MKYRTATQQHTGKPGSSKSEKTAIIYIVVPNSIKKGNKIGLHNNLSSL